MDVFPNTVTAPYLYLFCFQLRRGSFFGYFSKHPWGASKNREIELHGGFELNSFGNNPTETDGNSQTRSTYTIRYATP